MQVTGLVMLDMAGVPPRLLPGDIPPLGTRLSNAVTKAESLERRGERVYGTVEQAVERMLQVTQY